MHPRDPDPGRIRQLREPAARRVPVHPQAVGVAQDGPVVAAIHRVIDRSSYRRRQRDQHRLVSLAADLEHAMTVFFAEIADAAAAGFEDPQAEQPEHGDQGKVIDISRTTGQL
jgi:hypothetical protein